MRRYDAAGALDLTFGNSGTATLPMPTQSLAWDGADRIIGAGIQTSTGDIAVTRLDADGNVDTTFGTAGLATAAHAEAPFVTDVVVDSAGRAIVAGTNDYFAADSYYGVIARFDTGGALDTTFGTNGFIELPDAPVLQLLVDGDGLLVSGMEVSCTSGCAFTTYVARYDASGALDASFGDAGVARRPMLGLDPIQFSRFSLFFPRASAALARDESGRIVVATTVAIGDNQRIDLFTLTPAGAVDTDVGWLPLDAGNWRARRVFPRQGGGLTIAGDGFGERTGSDVAVLRLLPF
jgi:uncharacterized delta-60 repeat protein